MIPVAGAAGGLAAFGLWWLMWRLVWPATPAVRPAIARLYPGGVDPATPATPAWPARRLGILWRPPTRQLALLGSSPRQYGLSLGICALVGVVSAAAAATVLRAAGTALPVPAPIGAALLFGLLAAGTAHRSVIARAGRARYEFRRAICAYLDLVALELAAGWGPVAALERAAAPVDGWVFGRLREALLRAQLQLHTPWDELRALADRIEVPELGDVGEIVHNAGEQGAAVAETLLARADSLREQIRVEALAMAKATTAKLDIPGAALLLVLAVFVTYPLLIRATQF